LPGNLPDLGAAGQVLAASARELAICPTVAPAVLAFLHFLSHLNTSDAIAIAAAVVALVSAIAAVRANRIAGAANALAAGANELSASANSISGESNTIARAANEISEQARDLVARSVELEEAAHAERDRDRTARALLTAHVDPTELTLTGSHANLPLMLTIENVGNRDAGATQIELHVPNHVNSMMFAWEDEQLSRERTRSRPIRDETLIDDEGREFGAIALDRQVTNVTSAMPARLGFVMPIQLPQKRQTYPIRVIARAEDAAEPLRTDLTVTVIQGPG
jgi:hypothetical protein